MKKKTVNSQLCNINTYNLYKREMVMLAENVFQFKNLPNYIDVSYLNRVLLKNGAIAFFKDEVLGLIALPFDIIGNLDIYGRPIQIMARAFNGRYFRKLNRDEFVIMYDNNGRYSLYIDILQMAERIACCVRTNDVNIIHQRTPRIWKTTRDKELSLRNMIDDIDAMCETVVTYDSIDIDDMNVVVAPAPYVADKIDVHLKELWAEFYRLIGISNVQLTKKERLIRDEMTASLGGTIANRFSRFEPRKRAIDEINKKFGTDIKVEYYDGEPSTDENLDVEVNENAIL